MGMRELMKQAPWKVAQMDAGFTDQDISQLKGPQSQEDARRQACLQIAKILGGDYGSDVPMANIIDVIVTTLQSWKDEEGQQNPVQTNVPNMSDEFTQPGPAGPNVVH